MYYTNIEGVIDYILLQRGKGEIQMLACREEVSKLTEKLVQKKSVVNSSGEREMGDFLYALISSFPYFHRFPNQLMKQETYGDSNLRYNIVAYVKGTKGRSSSTVILMGHLDTVGIDDFGKLKELACDPERLASALSEENVPLDVKEQIQSGKFMVGRGSLDMKSGIASHLYLLKYFSDHPEELKGNIVVLFTCDEEDSSNGILSAVPLLNELKVKEQFRYLAAINADFVTPLYEGDENRYIFKGTVGKLLPSFFIVGTETHAGSPFDGLDPNFLASYLTKEICYNPALVNEAAGELTMPPVSLKQTDLKPAYDVQTPWSAFCYYNFFVHSWSPFDVLQLLKKHAKIAFKQALDDYHKRYAQYAEAAGIPYKEKPWKARVYSFEELNTLLENEHGFKYIKHMQDFKQKLLEDESLDLRMYSARVVEESWKWMKDKGPAMILFYSSIYLPRIEVSEKSKRERRLLQALDYAIEQVQPYYPYPIITKNFFPYISDMSFMSISDDGEAINTVINNSPAWGTKFSVKYDEISDLNVPVINIGPYGYDGHKKYERVEIEYSHQIVPNLTKLVIENLLN